MRTGYIEDVLIERAIKKRIAVVKVMEAQIRG